MRGLDSSLPPLLRSVTSSTRAALSRAVAGSGYLVGEGFFTVLAMRRPKQKMVLQQVKSALVVRLDEIGDAVLTTAFLRELRGNLPGAWITLVVKPECMDLFSVCPYIDEVLAYRGRRPGVLGGARCWWDGLLLARRHLWPRHFDLAIVPRWDVDYYRATFLAHVSGASWRAGYSERVVHHKQRLNRGYDRFLTHPILDVSPKHEAARSLELIRRLGGTVRSDRLELWTRSEDERDAETILLSRGIRSGDILIALGPGAGAPKRIWPASRFGELAAWLVEEYGARIVVLGGRGEEHLGEAIQRRVGDAVVNLVGETTLRQTVAVLKRCQLFIGDDSGPMHMAAAVGLPVVEISCHPHIGWALHSNSPSRFGPWGVPSVVLQPESACPPCTDGCEADDAHCILGVEVSRVRSAVARLLEDKLSLAPRKGV